MSYDIMWLHHVSFTHIKKVSWNVKACKEDIKRPAPEGESLQVSDGEACSAAGTVIQTHSQLLIWVGTTEYKSTIATRQRETEQASTLTGSSGNTFVPNICQYILATHAHLATHLVPTPVSCMMSPPEAPLSNTYTNTAGALPS